MEEKMNTIEVRHSLFTNNTIEDLLHSYEIGKNLKCEFLTRGLNDTYIIETENNKFIFRIYRNNWRDKSDILFELDAINHLSQSGFSVSKPIRKKEGEWLTEIPAPEGTRYGVLFTFSKGDRPEINEDNCFLIGKALGRIHKASDSFSSNNKRNFELNLDHLLNQPFTLINSRLEPFLKEKGSFLNRLQANLNAELSNIKTLDYGFCHGDFHNFNMHIEEQKIEAFDFDCCGIGYRSYDIAVFWWNLKQNYPSLENQCWDKFLNGYFTERSMNSENIDVLIKFIALRRIWFMATLLKNDDLWGRNWINQKNIDHFAAQLEDDASKF